MKKTLIALAAVAATGAAMAQVTLSGAFSVSVQKSAGDANAAMAQTDGALTFAASEDLGGGMKFSASQGIGMTGRGGDVAAENFMSALTTGVGTFEYRNFNAGSTLLGMSASLPTDFNGAIGGDATLSYFKYTAPTLVAGLGLNVASYTVGAANTLDVTEIATKDQANAWGASYAAGAFSANVEYRQDNKRTRVGLGYDAGVAKIGYRTETKVASGAKQTNLTVTAPLGATTVGLFYGKKGAVKGTGVSASYALSKRTSVSVNYGNVKGATDIAATAGADESTMNGTAYRVKLSHSF